MLSAIEIQRIEMLRQIAIQKIMNHPDKIYDKILTAKGLRIEKVPSLHKIPKLSYAKAVKVLRHCPESKCFGDSIGLII